MGIMSEDTSLNPESPELLSLARCFSEAATAAAAPDFEVSPAIVSGNFSAIPAFTHEEDK